MKNLITLAKTITLSTLATLLFSLPALAQDDTGITIARLVTCEGVADHEPVNETKSFSASTQKAYAFLEARNIAQPTEVNFVWSFEGSEMARVTVALGKSARWRTYANKNLAGRKGAWKVEIQDLHGKVLSATEFTVE
ncbi:MAG: DUF2914 domain-containing protein [Proteobacteria bacterium]|nr:DUF2914 domain-containing protein [Pseudomonadota bacterium]MBU1714498.1 DUF2914 domain-containing protein [Pseudomonadota bacterium]